jgi:hypothetical protein
MQNYALLLLIHMPATLQYVSCVPQQLKLLDYIMSSVNYIPDNSFSKRSTSNKTCQVLRTRKNYMIKFKTTIFSMYK